MFSQYQNWTSSSQPELCDYVADLQLHMTLQARHLVPSLAADTHSDGRLQLLQRTQTDAEIITSRSWL